jgi:hypothetical protein
MVLLDGSAPVTPPEEPPAALENGWTINLNPQQGSSILGPRSPAAGAFRPPVDEAAPPPRAPVWRAETVTYVPTSGPPATPVPFQVQPIPAADAPRTSVDLTSASVSSSLPRPAFRPTAPPPTPLLLPLVWVNGLFDRVVIAFGPPGRWLRSPSGRTALGVSGLLMLAGGVAWGVLALIGWTW